LISLSKISAIIIIFQIEVVLVASVKTNRAKIMDWFYTPISFANKELRTGPSNVGKTNFKKNLSIQ